MATLIKSITLFRTYDSGNLQGSITFTNSLGEIKVNLDAKKVERLVAVLADEIVATAQDTAKLMVADVLEDAGVKALV